MDANARRAGAGCMDAKLPETLTLFMKPDLLSVTAAIVISASGAFRSQAKPKSVRIGQIDANKPKRTSAALS
jgi:hypothetical protein